MVSSRSGFDATGLQNSPTLDLIYIPRSWSEALTSRLGWSRIEVWDWMSGRNREVAMNRTLHRLRSASMVDKSCWQVCASHSSRHPPKRSIRVTPSRHLEEFVQPLESKAWFSSLRGLRKSPAQPRELPPGCRQLGVVECTACA